MRQLDEIRIGETIHPFYTLDQVDIDELLIQLPRIKLVSTDEAITCKQNLAKLTLSFNFGGR